MCGQLYTSLLYNNKISPEVAVDTVDKVPILWFCTGVIYFFYWAPT